MKTNVVSGRGGELEKGGEMNWIRGGRCDQ